MLFTISNLNAQDLAVNKYSIDGKVIDSHQNPIVDAIISLYNSADSSLVKMEISGNRGEFEFSDIAAGILFLKVEVENSVTEIVKPFIFDKNWILEPVTVRLLEKEMAEVVITQKKPYMERAQGKLILNVENSINSAGSSAFELIEKAPGIRVNNNDNISLNGKPGVMVLIDGKRIPMSSSELANYLRGIPSGSIEKIELIGNPSVKYDAAGSSVIDIRLKKDTRIGTNGSVTSSFGHGVYPKANEGFSLNHRNKKINVYGSYNYSYRKAFNKLELDRKFYENGVYKSAYIQDNYLIFPFKNHISRLGLDYVIDSKNSISVLVNGVNNKFNPTGTNFSDVLDENEVKVSSFQTINNSKDNWYNLSGNLNFKHKIDTLGAEFVCDLDYAFYGNKTEQNFDTRYYGLDGVENQNPYILFGDLRGDLSIYSFKGDYTKPFGEKGLFESGVKSSYVIADNNLMFYNRSNGSNNFDSTKSNHFIYRENINAAYVNWENEYNKWKWKFGLRIENTKILGRQLVNATSFDTSYLQFFPNISTTYAVNDKNSFELNISRRIDRPSYEQLNPFKFYLDPTTYKEGNPYLRPQITNSVEVSHLWDQKIYTSLSVSRINRNITEVIAPSLAQQNVTVQTVVNLDHVDIYSLNMSIPWDITKWWNMTNNVGSYLSQYTGFVSNTQITNRGSVNYNINMVNTFKFGKSFSGELTGMYQSKEIYGFDFIQPIRGISAGVQARVLKNKGVIKLNVSDLLFTQKIQADVAFTDYKEHFLVTRETRVATLAFSYKFGNSNVPVNRRRNGGADDIKERVKNGMG